MNEKSKRKTKFFDFVFQSVAFSYKKVRISERKTKFILSFSEREYLHGVKRPIGGAKKD